MLGELAAKRANNLRKSLSTEPDFPPVDNDLPPIDYEIFDWEAEQRDWLADQFESLTSKLTIIKPSEWAEEKRYLPPSVTPLPGFYRFEVAPYMREPLDCLSIDSPIRHIAFMKGVQLGATSGLIENGIGYFIGGRRTRKVDARLDWKEHLKCGWTIEFRKRDAENNATTAIQLEIQSIRKWLNDISR